MLDDAVDFRSDPSRSPEGFGNARARLQASYALGPLVSLIDVVGWSDFKAVVQWYRLCVAAGLDPVFSSAEDLARSGYCSRRSAYRYRRAFREAFCD